MCTAILDGPSGRLADRSSPAPTILAGGGMCEPAGPAGDAAVRAEEAGA